MTSPYLMFGVSFLKIAKQFSKKLPTILFRGRARLTGFFDVL
jgi:hypothetical protein